MCSCGKPKKPISSQPASTMSASGNFAFDSISPAPVEGADKQQMVQVEYTGPVKEPFNFASKVSRDKSGNPIRYRFANNEQHRIKAVFFGDAEFLTNQRGRDGKPMYRIVSNVNTVTHDPAAFLGQSIMA